MKYWLRCHPTKAKIFHNHILIQSVTESVLANGGYVKYKSIPPQLSTADELYSKVTTNRMYIVHPVEIDWRINAHVGFQLQILHFVVGVDRPCYLTANFSEFADYALT